MKRMVMILAAVAIITGAGLGSHMTAEASKAAKIQMMEICCPHCQENINIDVKQDDVECPECAEHIHIAG